MPSSTKLLPAPGIVLKQLLRWRFTDPSLSDFKYAMENTTEDVSFGRAFGKKHFMFKPGYVHLNQGSYGGHPGQVRDALRLIQDEVQAEPGGFVYDTSTQSG
ncbi:hypothetical protein EDD37DRAFT_646297 [Exophiala viscosa]|uniref:uncharacterized protein n=1 Tax=Exophiala viscosa TaxID=2486360 RepID=UPI0021946154|nr:hypothetical protein EDD37DRAFT_646297 [Exophiala viscosa]